MNYKNSKSEVLGASIFDIFKGVRRDYPPDFKKLKNEIGDIPIIEIRVCRKPVSRNITNLINVFTLGKLNEIKGRLSYDELFHLFLFMQLENNKWIRMEKNQVLNLQYYNFNDPDNECIWIDHGDRLITVNSLLEPMEKNLGDELYLYNAKTNNCQFFVKNVLKYSNLLTPDSEKFIMQDSGKIIEKLGLIPEKLMNTATDFAALVDRVVKGGKIDEVNILPYPFPVGGATNLKFKSKNKDVMELLDPKIIKQITINITKSPNKNKKLRASIGIEYKDDSYYYDDIDFGAKNMSDYTKHKDSKRKENYIKRMTANKNNEHYNILSPAFWSMWVLWNKKTIVNSLQNIVDSFRENYKMFIFF